MYFPRLNDSSSSANQPKGTCKEARNKTLRGIVSQCTCSTIMKALWKCGKREEDSPSPSTIMGMKIMGGGNIQSVWLRGNYLLCLGTEDATTRR